MGGQRCIKEAMVCEFVSILTQFSCYLLLLSIIMDNWILPSSSSAPPTPISAETTSLSPTALVGQVSVVRRPDRRLRGLTDDRNRLSSDLVAVLVCMKMWWNRNLVAIYDAHHSGEEAA
jgi:hypothetical protein